MKREVSDPLNRMKKWKPVKNHFARRHSIESKMPSGIPALAAKFRRRLSHTPSLQRSRSQKRQSEQRDLVIKDAKGASFTKNGRENKRMRRRSLPVVIHKKKPKEFEKDVAMSRRFSHILQEMKEEAEKV